MAPPSDDWPGRLEPDATLQLLDGGRVAVGGSPLHVLRFRAPLVIGDVRSPSVVARLVDLGMAHPHPPPRDPPPPVTVVIPVHDDPSGLAASLASLEATPRAQVPRIVVVDDASRDADAVAAVIATFDDDRIERIVHATNAGAGAARNTGLERVDTAVVAFLDAGCEVSPGWLIGLAAHLADPMLAAVAPRIVAAESPARTAVPDDAATRSGADSASRAPARTRRLRRAWDRWASTRIARYEQVRSALDLGPAPARVAPRTRVAYVPSACLVARTAAVRAVGGFDASLRVGEDVDLVWRLVGAAPPARVRYEPAVHVAHAHRVTPLAWWRRRVDYGTSAAPLARRHPGALAPVTVSPWSAAAWGAVALGHPLLGVGVAAVSTAELARRIRHLPDGQRLALRIAARGNLGAGRLLADALRRPWWPLALGALAAGPRPVRRAVLAAWLVPPLVSWLRDRPPLDPVSWLVLCSADDVAYGTGVWLGCLRQRTLDPLRPARPVGVARPPLGT